MKRLRFLFGNISQHCIEKKEQPFRTGLLLKLLRGWSVTLTQDGSVVITSVFSTTKESHQRETCLQRRGSGDGGGVRGIFRLNKAHNETKRAHQEYIYLKKKKKSENETKWQNVYGRRTDGAFPVGSGAWKHFGWNSEGKKKNVPSLEPVN